MRSSSRLIASSVSLTWLSVGLAVLGSGCSRVPKAPRPTRVYVNADQLVRSHPKWETVEALDRQIAWLSNYRVRSVTPPRSAAVDVSIAAPDLVEVDMAALRRRIESTLDDVRKREREILEARLERERRRTQADIILSRRYRIEEEAEQRFQAVLDRWGLRLANMVVQLSAITALERTYAGRGPSWDALEEQMKDRRVQLEVQIEAARDSRTEEVLEVFEWLKARFAAAAGQEEANALEWIREHRVEIDRLNRSIDEQKLTLLNALEKVAPPSATLADLQPVSTRVAAAPGVAPGIPPLSAPNLESRIAALRARRQQLVRYIAQNTKAIIKAAARRQDAAMEPEFEPSTAGLPDRTEFFRPFVSDPTDELRRVTDHSPY